MKEGVPITILKQQNERAGGRERRSYGGGTLTMRKIVKIDEEKCDGCGQCIVNCPEGALQIVDGKARLIRESYCDGLGACLNECPLGAITIEERASDAFDEEAVSEHMAASAQKASEAVHATYCPGAAMRQMTPGPGREASGETPSQLTHWPVQLTLVRANAPFLKGADLLLVADCVPFALGDFHQRFLAGGHPVVVGCPKLDDVNPHVEKLRDIFARASLRSLTIVHMEVPCCGGLCRIVERAMEGGAEIPPVKEVTVGTDGKVIVERQW